MERWVIALIAVGLGGALVVGGARAALIVVRVDGTSMLPTFQPGDAVLALRRRVWRRVRRGDIIVCRVPTAVSGPPALLIKRVVALAGDELPGQMPTATQSERVPEDCVYVRGDGPGSYDSRRFGPIPLDRVVGHVVARLSPRRCD